MNREEYFKNLLTLYENRDGLPEQNEIADAGSDVEEENLDNGGADANAEMVAQEEIPENAEEQGEIPGDLDDASYMQEEQPEMQINNSDIERKLRLFDLIRNMMKFTESLIKTIDELDLSTIDDINIKKIDSIKYVLNSVYSKIRDYVTNIYQNQTYEQGLYTYVLLRSELLTSISFLREIFLLNKKDDEKK